MDSLPLAEYVSTRRFGAATVTVVNEASGNWPLELTDGSGEPITSTVDADEGARRVPIGFHVVHIGLGDASVLVDAGFDDPDTDWGRNFATEWSGVLRTPGLTSGLAGIGTGPDEITHVLITHAHFDHIAGLTVEKEGEHIPRFSKAKVFIGREDWERNPDRQNPESEVAVRLGAIERHGLLNMIDFDLEVVPGITMIPSPGESPGHCIARVSSEGESFFALGDLFHHRSEVEHIEWTAPWANKQLMVKSRERLLRDAHQAGSTFVFSHHPFPPWGRLTTQDGVSIWQQG